MRFVFPTAELAQPQQRLQLLDIVLHRAARREPHVRLLQPVHRLGALCIQVFDERRLVADKPVPLHTTERAT